MEPFCPICNNRIGEDERLVAEFLSKYGWWVTWHLKPAKPDEYNHTRFPGYKTRCGVAGQFELVPATFTTKAEPKIDPPPVQDAPQPKVAQPRYTVRAVDGPRNDPYPNDFKCWVQLQDNKTGKYFSRRGYGKFIGNFSPIWVTIDKQEYQLTELERIML
jgi:hypothetical protein